MFLPYSVHDEGYFSARYPRYVLVVYSL